MSCYMKTQLCILDLLPSLKNQALSTSFRAGEKSRVDETW